MGDLFFVVRMLVITLVIVVLMQIKIGETTIEAKAQDWLRSSSAVEVLRDVAHGAVKAAGRAYQSVVAMIDAKANPGFDREQVAGSRAMGLRFERSEGYKREQAEKAKRQSESEQTYGTDDLAGEADSDSMPEAN